jgi:hypothetical protein
MVQALEIDMLKELKGVSDPGPPPEGCGGPPNAVGVREREPVEWSATPASLTVSAHRFPATSGWPCGLSCAIARDAGWRVNEQAGSPPVAGRRPKGSLSQEETSAARHRSGGSTTTPTDPAAPTAGSRRSTSWKPGSAKSRYSSHSHAAQKSGPRHYSLHQKAGRTATVASSSFWMQTSSVSVRERLKNRGKCCETMKGKIPGQPTNQLVADGSGSISHG